MPKQIKSRQLFAGFLILGLITLLIGLYLIISSCALTVPTSYNSTKPLHAYNSANEFVAWVNVTLQTNSSAPQANFPVNVTVSIRGLLVPTGNWTYAYLEGATASSPDDELPGEVITLNNLFDDPFTYTGSRVMNYSSEGDWTIYVHVTSSGTFIYNNIPPNPTNIPLVIYSVPSAVHIANAESISQMKALEDSGKTGTFWTGVALAITGSGFLLESNNKREKKG